MNRPINSSELSRTALIFPGQGSQFPGMGADLARESDTAGRIIQHADKILGYPLSEIMMGDDLTELNRTVHTQPAVFVYSIALFEALKEIGEIGAIVCAGHSLGEYSALTASGALSFEQALKLIRLRAKSMDEAQPEGACGMAALLGMDDAQVENLLQEIRGDDVVEAANFNAPGQVVISGHIGAIVRAMDKVKGIKGVRAAMLPVSSAFHTSLMSSAKDSLLAALKEVTFKPGAFPVIANVNARPYGPPLSEHSLLAEQVTGPVLWRDCIKTMSTYNPTLYLEVGPGKVLTGLMRRIDRKAHAISISSLEEGRAFFGTLS